MILGDPWLYIIYLKIICCIQFLISPYNFKILFKSLALILNYEYYLLKCPRSRLVVSLAKFPALSHELNYEYENHSFLTTQEPYLRIIEKTRNNFKREPFCFFRRIIFLFFYLSEREENIFILFMVFRERNQNISLWFFGREFSLREFSLIEMIKKKLFYLYLFFNSGSFLVVLKLLETVSLFSHLFGSG